jgi:hypothetical protein
MIDDNVVFIDLINDDEEPRPIPKPISPTLPSHIYKEVTPERIASAIGKYKNLSDVINQLVVSQYVSSRGIRLENTEAFIALCEMSRREDHYEK